MGGNGSRSSEDSDEDDGQRRSPRQRPKLAINTVDLLDGISNKCEEWLNVISNMKQEKWKDKEAQSYVLQELVDTKIEIDVLVEDLQSVIVPYTQRPHTHDKTGQQRKRKKSGNTKPSKQGTQVVQLQERLQTAEEVKTMYVKHNRDLTEKLVKEKKTSEKAECERQNVLLRLSQVTGDKLKSENPNIADLGDPNRPTKLGEMISELYDNEWTDAFEGLQRNGRSDRSSIRILLETFMDAFVFCSKERNQILRTSECKAEDLYGTKSTGINRVKLKRTTSTAHLPTESSLPNQTETDCILHQTEPFLFYEWLDKNAENVELSKNCGVQRETDIALIEDFHKSLQFLQKESNKKSQELLKEYGERLEPLIEQAYLETRWTSNCIKSLKPYIIKCLYMSWMMCIQTPPMAVAKPAKSGTTFGSAMYKQYTVKGPCVDYIVWPAILLHENGPVISKGVAQGKEI